MSKFRSIAVTCVVWLFPTVSVAQTIVWTDQYARRIQRKDVDGGEVKTIIQFPSLTSASTVHYDPVTAKLYYLLLVGTSFSFQRANLDGSGAENIPTPSAGGFTLNVDSRKLYWGRGCGSTCCLYRSDLNGTGVESHAYANCGPTTIEAFGDDLFFGAGGAMLKGVWRADADGSNEHFLNGTAQPADLAYDPVDKKLYCGTIADIVRMNLDGTGFQQLPISQSDFTASQVVVDYRRRKLYWADYYAKVIRRSNLDGTDVEDFVTTSDVGNPNFDISGLTIIYTYTPIPALSGWGVIVMGLILVGASTFVLRKRHLTQSKRTTDGQHER